MRLMSSTSWERIFTTVSNLFRTFMFYILKSAYLYRSHSRGFFKNHIFLFSPPFQIYHCQLYTFSVFSIFLHFILFSLHLKGGGGRGFQNVIPFIFKLIITTQLCLCVLGVFVLVCLIHVHRRNQFSWSIRTLACILVGRVGTYLSACIYTQYVCASGEWIDSFGSRSRSGMSINTRAQTASSISPYQNQNWCVFSKPGIGECWPTAVN